MQRATAVWVTALTLSPACSGPPAVAPPVTAEVLSHVAPGVYQLLPERLETLVTLRGGAVEGGSGQIRGGGVMHVTASADPHDEDDVRRLLAVKDAHDLALEYEVDGGVVRGTDYDTFAVLTIYRELERVRAFYRDLGVPEDALHPMPAFYRARIDVLFLPLLAANNAAYSPAIDGFMLFTELLGGNDVPLALNLGVIGHEYGHAIFNHLAWEGRIPPAIFEGWPPRATNHLRAIDEGLADLFGATLTGDSDFVARSVAQLSIERDLGAFRVAGTSLLSDAESDEASFNPYELGAVIASALWHAGETIGRTEIARYVLAAEQSLAGHIDRDFTVDQLLDRIVRAARDDAGHRRELCATFAAQLAAAGPFPCCSPECK